MDILLIMKALALLCVEFSVSIWSIHRDTEVTSVSAGRSFIMALQHRATAKRVPCTREAVEV